MVAGSREGAVQSRLEWWDSASGLNGEPTELTGSLDVG